MASRKNIFSICDGIWLQGHRPSVRNVIRQSGGSARDVGPLVKMWWLERTQERRAVDQTDVQILQTQFDEQRRYYMQQIDVARQETRQVRDLLAKSEELVRYYRNTLKDAAPPLGI